MEDIIDDKEATKELVDKINEEIEEMQKTGIPDMEVMAHCQYMYNIAWMKMYSLLEKAKQ